MSSNAFLVTKILLRVLFKSSSYVVLILMSSSLDTTVTLICTGSQVSLLIPRNHEPLCYAVQELEKSDCSNFFILLANLVGQDRSLISANSTHNLALMPVNCEVMHAPAERSTPARYQIK
jgi:hypothetical protein